MRSRRRNVRGAGTLFVDGAERPGKERRLFFLMGNWVRNSFFSYAEKETRAAGFSLKLHFSRRKRVCSRYVRERESRVTVLCESHLFFSFAACRCFPREIHSTIQLKQVQLR
ncbi:uncharacterized protein LOC143180836 [Calliopsis andreniformis]|uniref:uncharacterized protein LOC143180836 n=1 Tax=Calliopsis andreniformis TaxID=337506 RepID=UPI003FCCC000